MSTRWFLIPERLADPAMRLVCLPYAGGSAAVYRPWAAVLAPDIEVLSAQLPGRGWRLREAPSRNLHALADELADAIAELGDLPVAVFGHSMGSWIGLEVVRRLEAMGRPPVRFFASGRQAPTLGCTQPRMAHLSDDEFIREMGERYGGIPEEILAERELLELLLPSVRADIELLERHEHVPGRPVSIPIHAIVGDRDTVVAPEEMAPWAEETARGFRVTALPGGHFYFQPDPAPLLSILRRDLEEVLWRGAGIIEGV